MGSNTLSYSIIGKAKLFHQQETSVYMKILKKKSNIYISSTFQLNWHCQ